MMNIPANVPTDKKELFSANLKAITRAQERLFLFAADQKIEHLNEDFHGEGIHKDAADPEHLFRIAQQGNIGAFATQLGLIERYGRQYPAIDYIVKLNSKTNIIKANNRDPLSNKLWSVDDVIALKKMSGLSIRGIGYTIYLGSEFEDIMLKQAAQAIHNAHKEGLVAILWIYPRGFHVNNDTDLQLLAGAAGVANALGADIVKIKPPKETKQLKVIKQAAGNTLVITSGGKKVNKHELLQRIYDQIHTGHSNGAAIGRNIFQHSLQDAIKLTQAISALVYDDASVDQAAQLL